jgi:CheY-like chemotaxis protein
LTAIGLRTAATAAEGTGLEEHIQGQRETLLLVDDEPQVCEMLRVSLECLHYRVLTAANGAEALVVYERYKDAIALVLTDLVMPVMGGVELCRALWQRNSGVKILVMTACPLGEARQAFQEERLLGWLYKPFALAELAQAVRRVL